MSNRVINTVSCNNIKVIDELVKRFNPNPGTDEIEGWNRIHNVQRCQSDDGKLFFVRFDSDWGDKRKELVEFSSEFDNVIYYNYEDEEPWKQDDSGDMYGDGGSMIILEGEITQEDYWEDYE
jgi:hypothetical protein